MLPIFSKKEVLSSEGSSPSSSEHTLSNATTSKKDVDVDVFTLARDCCGEIFLRVFEKDVWKRQRGQLVVSNGLFGLGLPEIVVIGGVTALLFGPSKLPELGKSLGKTVKSFQSAANEFNEELKKEVDEGNKDGEETKKEEE